MELEILILIIIFVVIPFYSSYKRRKRFEKSNYKVTSGNTYNETVKSKGAYGEYLTYEVLENLPGTNHIFPNVYIPKGFNGSTEIDIVMVNKTGIYVFESKNYSGWIYGSDKNKMWTQTFKTTKNQFLNPVMQNNGHIKALKDMIKEYTGFENVPIYSYIVFSDRCTFHNISISDRSVRVVKRLQLRGTVESDIIIRQEYLSDLQVNTISNLLHCYSNVDEAKKEEHIRNINNHFH